MIQARVGYRRAAVAIGAALILTAAPIGTPPAYADSEVTAFTIGSNGNLYKSTGGQPTLVHTQRVSSPGGGVATIRHSDGGSSVYAIGIYGNLLHSRTVAGGSTTPVTDIGPRNQAPPGAPIATVGQDVFFVSYTGAVFRKSNQNTPQQVTTVGIAPHGAVVAAIPGPNPGVAFVGTDGAFRVVRSNSTGTWTTTATSPPNFATPGGGLAVISNLGGFVTGLDGRIWQVRLGGPLPDPWAPVAVAGVGAAPAGAHLSAVRFLDGPAVVMFAGHDGAIWATSNVAGTWHEPTAATAAGLAVPGKPVAATIHGDHLDGDWCGNGTAWQIRIPKPRPPVGPHPEPWDATTFSFSAPNIQAGGHVANFLL